MVKAQAGILETDSAEEAEEKLRREVARLRRRRGRGRAGSRPTCARSSVSPRRGAGGDRARGLRGLAPLLRGPRRAEPARARVRGSPLGRRGPARLRRPPRRLGDRRAAARRLHRPPGAARAPARLGRRQAQRHDDLAVAALRRRDAAPARRACSSRPSCRASCSRRCSRAQAATRSTPRSSCACSPSAESRVRRDELPVPAVGSGHHRRPARHAARRGEGGPPGRGGPRPDVLARRRRAPRRRRARDRSSSACARSSARSSCAASAARPSRARPSTRSATCSFATSPTGRSRAPGAPTSTGWPPSGSRRCGRPRTTPRRSRTTTRGRSSWRARVGQDTRAIDVPGTRSRSPRPATGRPRSRLRGGGALLRRAAELWPRDDPDWPSLRFRQGTAPSTGPRRLEPTSSGRRATGCSRRATPRRRPRRRSCSGGSPSAKGDGEATVEHYRARAIELLEGAPASTAKARVLGALARSFLLAAESRARDRRGTRGRLRWPRSSASTRSAADGVDDDRRRAYRARRDRRPGRLPSAESTSREELSSPEAITGQINLADSLSDLGELDRAAELRRSANRTAERFGDARSLRWLRRRVRGRGVPGGALGRGARHRSTRSSPSRARQASATTRRATRV